MPTQTVASLDQRVLDRLEGNSVFYVQSERYNALNEALRALNLFVGFTQATVNVPGGTQIGRHIYDQPAGIIFPLAVAFNNRPLIKSTLPNLVTRSRLWVNNLSSTTGPVKTWVALGTQKFIIDPADAVGGGTLAVTGVVEPTTLVNPTDIVQCPDHFTDTLVDYAAHVMQLKEGGKIFADSAALYHDFQSQMKEFGRWRNMQQPRYWIEVSDPKGTT
jgi:hypothetical protein